LGELFEPGTAEGLQEKPRHGVGLQRDGDGVGRGVVIRDGGGAGLAGEGGAPRARQFAVQAELADEAFQPGLLQGGEVDDAFGFWR
jgi:hypothetical protein